MSNTSTCRLVDNREYVHYLFSSWQQNETSTVSSRGVGGLSAPRVAQAGLSVIPVCLDDLEISDEHTLTK